ncbi:MAG: T9SS type A sorting domain-containing protein [Bacteroidales bacterium]|nr:T9SS type A sorting domain-containing protein [Bacteroidales bacterium]
MLFFGLLAAQAQNTWYLEDFESLGILGPFKPEGWTVSEDDHGNATFKPAFQGFESDMAFSVQMPNASTEYWFYTQSLAFGTQPVVEFQYKTAGVVGDAPDNCMSLELAVSADGETWTTVKTVAAAEFVSTSDYKLFRETLPTTYAGTNGYVRLKVTPETDAGTVNFYVDDFGVGTKPQAVENDLMIQGELAGSSMPSVNAEAEYTFTVFNNGTKAQAAYAVQLLNAARTVLASENITAAIEAGATAEHTLKFTPTQTGADKLYAVVVLEGDENRANDTAALEIDVQAEGNTVVEVGKGTMLIGGQPFSFMSKTSIALALYTPDELNGMAGDISALAFEGNFATEITLNTQVYVGETDETSIPYNRENFQSLFIDPATLTKVFDGEMTFPQGDHQSIRFEFTQPFAYSAAKNLAVYTFSSIAAEDVLEDWDANKFYATSVPFSEGTLALANEGDNINPMKPNDETDASMKFQRPNTKFFFSSVSDEKYSLTFAVKDAAGKALSGAVVTLNGQQQEAGKYTFEDMPARLYNYMVEKDGFVPARGTLRLTADMTQDVTLLNLAEYPGLTGYLFEDFENIAQNRRPLNWVGDFYVDEEGGKNDGHCLTHNFWFMDGPRYIATNPVFMGSEPVFEFEYRVMAMNTQNLARSENAYEGENLSWTVEVSEDFGATWKILYQEDYGTHESSKDYKPFSIDVSDYAGKICQFQINVQRDYGLPGEFYFDIDNVKIGTQVENDLAVVSKIEGMRVPEAGVKTAYTVSVRNQGSVAAENYSLVFYNGETELGRVAGTKIESGAFAKLVFEHTFAEAGEYTLTARCVMEADEFLGNNGTAEFYVSAQPKGIASSMVEAYEGEDLSYPAPFYAYDYNSLSWILYNRNDLDFEADNNISGMAFRTKFDEDLERLHLTIYIGETNQDNIMTSVPVPASLTKAFDGVVNIEARDGGNFVINFQRAYRYTGKNLIVAIYKEATQPCGFGPDFGFYGFYNLGPTSVSALHSEDPIDLTNINLTPEAIRQMGAFCKPSTIFLLRDDISYHTVNFEITDQNGQAVKNATVTFDGQMLKAGNYKVENVPDGTYAYTVSLDYETVGGEVVVSGADVTEKVQLKHVANESNLKETMVRIYPNPTTDKLHIDVAEGAREINLYDISGRPVQKLNRVPAGVIEMDLSDCHSGIYLLMVDGKAFKISKR